MAKSRLKPAPPTTENRTVTPLRLPNAKLPTREHLTEGEVDPLIEVAKINRWGHRDAAMVLVAFRHGFRASELVDLQWTSTPAPWLSGGRRRARPAPTPIRGDEMRALRKLAREQNPKSPFVFTSERGAPFTTAGFARLVERAGRSSAA